MFSVETLKNIHIKDFENFFREKKVKRWSIRTKDAPTVKRYEKILNVIEEELKDPEGAFGESEISELLFEKIFYENNNHEFILKYSSFFATSSTVKSKAEVLLNSHKTLRFNEELTNILKFSDKFEICSTKLECKSNRVSAIHMLVWLGSVEDSYGDTNFFTGITVDLENAVIIIRLNFSQLELWNQEPLKLFKNIKEMLSGFGASGASFTPLNLKVESLNEDTASESIFALYEELSSEAEALLNSRIIKGTEEKIKAFLKTMGISEVKEEYFEQIKAVIYQDIAASINPSLFKHGWIFRFDFREGDHTRAISNNEQRGPVYSSKTYWQLKELIYDEKRMHEAGFHWKLPGGKDFVDVKIIARNDTIIVHYYYKVRQNRKEKDEFVIRKIAKHIS